MARTCDPNPETSVRRIGHVELGGERILWYMKHRVQQSAR
jgi:hypothetical protein